MRAWRRRLAVPAIVATLGAAAVVAVRAQRPPASGSLRITLLSGRPDMVTGGDALVRISVPATVTLNGQDISSSVKQGVAVLTGLAVGKNTLVARNGNESSDAQSRQLSNHRPRVLGSASEAVRVSDRGLGTRPGPRRELFGQDEGRMDVPIDCSSGGPRRQRVQAAAFTRAARPPDLARTTTVNGRAVPYIVRLETGTINRAVYQIAVIADPSGPAPSPGSPMAGWNGRLVYTFGGSCMAGYIQGRSSGGVHERQPPVAWIRRGLFFAQRLRQQLQRRACRPRR